MFWASLYFVCILCQVGKLKTLLQWLVLIMFVMSGVLYRLMSYLLLFVHLNIFLMPAVAIMLVSFAAHIILRGLSNKFYVETTKVKNSGD